MCSLQLGWSASAMVKASLGGATERELSRYRVCLFNLTLLSKWKGNRPNFAQRKEGCTLVGDASVIENPIEAPSWPAEALDSI